MRSPQHQFRPSSLNRQIVKDFCARTAAWHSTLEASRTLFALQQQQRRSSTPFPRPTSPWYPKLQPPPFGSKVRCLLLALSGFESALLEGAVRGAGSGESLAGLGLGVQVAHVAPSALGSFELWCFAQGETEPGGLLSRMCATRDLEPRACGLSTASLVW